MKNLKKIVAAMAACGFAVVAADARAEAMDVKIATNPWLGYGQWYVAQDRSFFSKNGLGKVDLVNFAEDKDLQAAIASGQVEAANVPTHAAIAMIAAGIPVKAVMLEDFSMTADAILSSAGNVKTVQDLKGKEVAFEQGTTSDLLLNYALQSKGLSIKDVTPIPMSAANAGGALIANRTAAAVTYEPYISAAKKANPATRTVFTAGENPGLISDVLIVRTDFIKSHPGAVTSLVKSWDDSVNFYKANPAAGRASIAKGVGEPVGDLQTAFDGVRFYSLSENHQQLAAGGGFIQKTYVDVSTAAQKAGILKASIPASRVFDTQFVTK